MTGIAFDGAEGSINRCSSDRVIDDVKALIRSKSAVDPDKLADPQSPLADLLG